MSMIVNVSCEIEILSYSCGLRITENSNLYRQHLVVLFCFLFISCSFFSFLKEEKAYDDGYVIIIESPY